MPKHEFDFTETNPQVWTNAVMTPKDGQGRVEKAPTTLQRFSPKGKTEPREDIFFEKQNIDTSQEVHEILIDGFRTMDRGIKNYFSAMPVPSRDSIRIMQVRLTGGDKPYLIWAQDLKMGRVSFPVMSIKRESAEFHYQKFSPEGHYMAKKYMNSEGSRVALAFRPIPAMITYSLSVFAEHKTDLEKIGYQIHRRFHPSAEFIAEDEHLRGSVFMKYDGVTFAIDDDIPAEQRQTKRYDYRVTMEGWMALPPKVVPTILGNVTTLKEGDGRTAKGALLETLFSKQDAPIIETRRQ